MSKKVLVYIATSLDGFIARADGTLDWLEAARATVPEGEECGYGKFMASVDALVMGRKTYEQVLSFGPWPYGETPVMVLSSRDIDFPDSLPDCVSQFSGPPQAVLARLAAEGKQRIYVDGGTTIKGFLKAGLVDEITLTLIPVALGEGIRFYLPKQQLDLELLHSEAYPFGFVQLRYAVRNQNPRSADMYQELFKV